MISDHKYQAIAELDFSTIKLKLTHRASGEGWSQAKADAMETEYRRFLYLQAAFPGEQTAPTLDVDTFWHYHILDTMKYAADCEHAFGYFLHHYPYLGMLDGDEEGVEIEAGNRTRELYEATFGEAYIRAEAYGEDDGDAALARCTGLCTVAAPQAKGAAQARCTGLCTVAKPPAKGAAQARCTGLCTVAKPPAKGAAQARCTGLCTVAKPLAKGAAQARCTGLCTVAKPPAKGAAQARCTGLCTVAAPKMKEKSGAARCTGLCTVAIEGKPGVAGTSLQAPVIPASVQASGLDRVSVR